MERRFRVGAAVGSGMAAQAAERAGADFILALGAGKMRSMGVASPAALLPVYNGVGFTLDFAISELLPRTDLPVLVGLPLFDPRLEIDGLIEQLKSLGIGGLTNFPSIFHLGRQAEALTALGLGRNREVAFLATAKASGLETIGYVRSRADAVAMVEAGITTLCVNFSLNPDRHQEIETDAQIDRIAIAIKRAIRNLRNDHPNLTIYLGGGPVSGGASLDRLCRTAGIDGFIGGSALDRAPLEKSLLSSLTSFREIEVLQNRVQLLQQRLRRTGERYGITAHSDAMNEMLDTAERLAAGDGHVLICGEAGTGQPEVARLLADKMRSNRRRKSWDIAPLSDRSVIDQLFGRPASERQKRLVGVLELGEQDVPIILRGVECLDLTEQNRLAAHLADQPLPRLVMTMELPIEVALAEGRLSKALCSIRTVTELSLPPLRDRAEDIPDLARRFATDQGADGARLPGNLMRTLMRHDWPGNLPELRETIGWILQDRRLAVTEAALIAYLGKQPQTDGRFSEVSQKERIVRALLLNNLNRSRTADFLGVTRKTLYNQIKRYNITC